MWKLPRKVRILFVLSQESNLNRGNLIKYNSKAVINVFCDTRPNLDVAQLWPISAACTCLVPPY